MADNNLKENKFALVILASKRSLELNKGSRPFIEPHSLKSTSVALEEIQAGIIEGRIRSEKEEESTHKATDKTENGQVKEEEKDTSQSKDPSDKPSCDKKK